MFCPNCGKQLPDDSAFCGNCGVRVDSYDREDQHPFDADDPYVQTGYENSGDKSSAGRSGLKAPVIVVAAVIAVAAIAAGSLFIGKGKKTAEPVYEPVQQETFKPEIEPAPEEDHKTVEAEITNDEVDVNVTDGSSGPENESSALLDETITAGSSGLESESSVLFDEITTVTGGEWVEVASVRFYQKDGELVKNSWIEDKGVRYYMDEDGYMLRNAYTPDGYFVGDDGSYDPNAPENQADGGNYIEDTPAGEAMAAIAARLSTDETAGATEFDWFLDYVNNTGYGMADVITDPARATRINDLQPALNGGWKAFICTEDGVYGSDVERYLNAGIEASGGKFNITLNWRYMLDPSAGGTIEETGSTTYWGTYDETTGTATAETSYSRIDFDGFYLSKDGQTEYATGMFYWISGEKDRIALMRSSR